MEEEREVGRERRREGRGGKEFVALLRKKSKKRGGEGKREGRKEESDVASDEKGR